MVYAICSPNTCPSFRSSIYLRGRHLVSTKLRVTASFPGTNGLNVEYTPWLIVGLGNPGNKYHGTRHNVGFEMIDSISQKEGIKLNTIQSRALMGIGSIGEVPVVLAKTQTYMNFSGESVGPLAAYYQVPLRHILLVYDEMSLPNGVLRLQPKGGHGHHNGLKSVMEHLDGCREFPRLCIGIGNPPGTMDMRAFLLQKFSLEERKQVDCALEQGVEAVRTLVLKGFEDSITKFNLGQKYKYHKVELRTRYNLGCAGFASEITDSANTHFPECLCVNTWRQRKAVNAAFEVIFRCIEQLLTKPNMQSSSHAFELDAVHLHSSSLKKDLAMARTN